MTKCKAVSCAAFALLMIALSAGSGFAQSGSAGAGRATFQAKCAICHRTTPNANSIGPTLSGVYGRHLGAVEKYRYSPAMIARNDDTWDEQNLDAFLRQPKGFVEGTKMNFPGVPDASQRADLIAFLKSLSP